MIQYVETGWIWSRVVVYDGHENMDMNAKGTHDDTSLMMRKKKGSGWSLELNNQTMST